MDAVERKLRRKRRSGRLSRTTPDCIAASATQGVAEVRMTTAAGLETTRRDLLVRTAGWILIVFTILLPLVVMRDLDTRPWTIFVHLCIYAALLVTWLRHRQLGATAIAWVLLGSLFMLGTVGLLRTGIVGINGMAYGLLAIITPLIFGYRAGVVAAVLCGLAYVVVGTLTVTSVLDYAVVAGDYLQSLTNWIHTGSAFIGFITIATVISGTICRKLHDLLRSEAARGQMLAASNAQLAEANARLHEMNADLERRIDERISSLEQTNRELESFSYTISHDLRSPLQVIEGFSSLALQEGSTTKASEYLHKIQGGARRMHDMIGHLLKFSQLGTRVIQREQVNLSELAQRMLLDLQVTEPGRVVELCIEPDMVDSADPQLIGNVLHNLLLNAWKFSSRNPAARIEFSRYPRQGRLVYQVRDNGVGFDAIAAHRLFQPFVRFHDKREFHGSGVGLAIAKRIIDRHQGQLWVESRPGEGAAFFFTLTS